MLPKFTIVCTAHMNTRSSVPQPAEQSIRFVLYQLTADMFRQTPRVRRPALSHQVSSKDVIRYLVKVLIVERSEPTRWDKNNHKASTISLPSQSMNQQSPLQTCFRLQCLTLRNEKQTRLLGACIWLYERKKTTIH